MIKKKHTLFLLINFVPRKLSLTLKQVLGRERTERNMEKNPCLLQMPVIVSVQTVVAGCHWSLLQCFAMFIFFKIVSLFLRGAVHELIHRGTILEHDVAQPSGTLAKNRHINQQNNQQKCINMGA